MINYCYYITLIRCLQGQRIRFQSDHRDILSANVRVNQNLSDRPGHAWPDEHFLHVDGFQFSRIRVPIQVFARDGEQNIFGNRKIFRAQKRTNLGRVAGSLMNVNRFTFFYYYYYFFKSIHLPFNFYTVILVVERANIMYVFM